MTNIEIIKELYRCFSTKDYESFLDICSPELEWIQNPGVSERLADEVKALLR